MNKELAKQISEIIARSLEGRNLFGGKQREEAALVAANAIASRLVCDEKKRDKIIDQVCIDYGCLNKMKEGSLNTFQGALSDALSTSDIITIKEKE